jgi:glycosyltransferase involved in cell wall biosynthesis
MKIGISAFAGDSGKSGISQYMINILGRLPDLSDEDEYVLFMSESDLEFFDTKHSRVRIVTQPDWVGHPLVNILWHLLILPVLLHRHGCDCVYMPAGNRRLSFWYGCPSVGTVHDLSQLHVAGKYDPLRMLYIRKVLPRLMRRLTHVISVSQATRKDLMSHVRLEPGRIDVVYNGADLTRFQAMDKSRARAHVREKYAVDGPYILYTSRLEHPGKNHVRLLEAFASLKRDRGLPHRLVCAGSAWYGAETIYSTARELGIEQDVFFPGFVPNSDLPALYAGADLFVFPSLFEGFGIPLLEAMASGTPVCASNVASIPEVVRDAGLMFDPDSAADIASAMSQILNDADLARRLVKRGLKRSRLFSWDDSARQVLSICRAVMSAPG